MTTDKIIIYVLAAIIYILIGINFWLNHKWSQSEKRVNKLNHDLSNLWIEVSMYHRLERKRNPTNNSNEAVADDKTYKIKESYNGQN